MSRRLDLRVAVIALAVMALTLGAVALLTYQLVLNDGRAEVDRVLRQEYTDLTRGLPDALEQVSGSAPASAAQLELAVQNFLALHPGGDLHLTVVTIGERVVSTEDGPASLRQLVADGMLPPGVVASREADGRGLLTTAGTSTGDIRMLVAPIISDGAVIGEVQVLGSLADANETATAALWRILVAGLVGLLVGGVILVLAVRKALRPVGSLASAVRSADRTGTTARVPEPERLDEVGILATEFNGMLDRMRAQEDERRGLLSAVSHELRTPLAVAEGHLEMFETVGPAGGAEAADTARVLRGELKRLERIVDDLSAITAGGSSRLDDLGPVFVPDLIDDLRGRVAGLGLTGVAFGPAPPLVISGDEDRLAQALVNLVLNAVTHTPDGTAVRVTTLASSGDVEFAVRDEGQGIDPDLLPRVFEPFVTTRGAGSRRASGLGLAVVKAVTEAQGGQVQIETSAQGTTVRLVFPLADPH